MLLYRMVSKRTQPGQNHVQHLIALIRLAGLMLILGLVLIQVLGLAGCGSHVWHQVKQGETLYSISWRYGQDYHQVAAWNDIAPPYIISPGQVLRLTQPVARYQRPGQPGKAVTQPAGTDIQSEPTQTSTRVIAGSTAAVTQSTTDNSSSDPNIKSDSSMRSAAANVAWQWPVQGPILSQYSSRGTGNKGIDIAGNSGVPIKAAAGGKVVYAGSGLPSYGRLLIIKHNEKYLSAYAHNDNLLVQEGDTVEAGQAIATMGNTGTDRYKLHFEIRDYGQPKNPLKFLPKQ